MTSPGALSGLRVADFGRVLAAPYATMILADLGAEVIKLERPDGGDETRAWGPPWYAGESTYFLSVNRNKRSTVIDLATEQGRTEALELIRSCDVLVENFRPGTMARFGLDYDSLAEQNSSLVYCSVTGFGAGAGAGLPGYDLIVQAAGGLMSITGTEDGGPVKVGVALVDVITGLHAVAGILAALRHRDRTGEGQHVEVNLMSSLLSALTNQASGYLATGMPPGLLGNRHPSIAPYEVFETADRPLAIAAANDKLYGALAAAIGRPDLAGNPSFATNTDRVRNREPLTDQLNATLRSATAKEWFAILTKAGVPAAPINNLAQAFELAAELGLTPTHDLQVSNPILLSRTPVTYRTAAPEFPSSRDTRQIRSEAIPNQR